jgi:pimeloyl-ACP methyl ester carboxylesterase
MPLAQSNGVEVFYETFGDESGAPLLLINGLGSQCINYDVELREAFVDRGFFVIRFDNRDVGLTSKVGNDDLDFQDLLAKAFSGEAIEAPYLLSDMAADAMAVLDAVGVPAAHVFGQSMGGMIAQTIAVEHPDRVLTMTSVMSSTGDRDVGGATAEAMQRLVIRPPADREGYIAHSAETSRIIGTPAHFDEERARRRAAAAFDRCYFPVGTGRQMLAVMASGPRSDKLGDVKAPTLVIHGSDDPLVNLSGGERTAQSVPGAELLVIDGMGHDLPPPLWSQVIEAVTRHAARAATVTD